MYELHGMSGLLLLIVLQVLFSAKVKIVVLFQNYAFKRIQNITINRLPIVHSVNAGNRTFKDLTKDLPSGNYHKTSRFLLSLGLENTAEFYAVPITHAKNRSLLNKRSSTVFISFSQILQYTDCSLSLLQEMTNDSD